MKEIKEIADGQSFENIISDNQIYVDKTQDIYNFLKIKSRLFLSRPRRFGKSLVLDTIATLFEKGVEPYFKDTWIYDKWNEETYPVLRLNFLDFDKTIFEKFCFDFRNCINDFLDENKIDLVVSDEEPYQVIQTLLDYFVVNDRQIVIVIDEYDVQLTANINNNHLYNTFHAALRELYASLKGNEAIKFLGITGVTKFNIITGFSGTDIIDVTFHSAVATLIGFTRAEITKYYIDYLNLGVSLEKSKPIEEVSNQDPKSRIISTQNNSTKQI